MADTFAGLERFLIDARWVGRANRYSQDTIARIRSDLRSGAIRSPRQLAQYIAASTLLHSADGWSYLGKSIVALMRGDPHRSRHLAYYAELRGALSLLAGQGLGIFQHQHFAVNGTNSVCRLDNQKGTHEVVWNCLEYWSKRNASGDLFSSIVKPYGRTLDDWLIPLGGGRVVAAQVHQWFHQWGMDLKTFADDRNARNISSYRPDGIPDSWKLNAADTLSFVRSIWESFEPAPNSKFEVIDSNILRICLESRYVGRFGVAPNSDIEAFRQWVDPIVKYQNFPQAVAENWVSFLSRQAAADDAAVFKFAKDPPTEFANGHLGIISRAALLLRLAVGSTRRLIDEAGLSPTILEFWSQDVGRSRGLWDGDYGSQLVDLWADVAPLLEDIESFQSRHQPAQQSFFRAAEELGGAILGLASFERVALWSVVHAD